MTADTHRGLSRQRDFHESAHARYRSLKDGIPADLVIDSGLTTAADIADTILQVTVQSSAGALGCVLRTPHR